LDGKQNGSEKCLSKWRGGGCKGKAISGSKGKSDAQKKKRWRSKDGIHQWTCNKKGRSNLKKNVFQTLTASFRKPEKKKEIKNKKTTHTKKKRTRGKKY